MELILITYIVFRNKSLIHLSNLFPLIFLFKRIFNAIYFDLVFPSPTFSQALPTPLYVFYLSFKKKKSHKKNKKMEIKTTSQQDKIKEQASKNLVKTKQKKQKSPPPHTHNTHKQTNPMEFILRCPTTPGRGARSGGNWFILFQLVLIVNNFWIGSGIPRPRPLLSAGLMHAAIVYKLLCT